jgi:hypothetical protein
MSIRFSWAVKTATIEEKKNEKSLCNHHSASNTQILYIGWKMFFIIIDNGPMLIDFALLKYYYNFIL